MRALGGLVARSAGSRLARLRVLTAGTALLAVLFGVLGAIGIGRRDEAIQDVRVAAQQLIALQEVRVSAVRADAVASSSYLVGGQEDPAKRQDYLNQIAASSNGLIEIANRVDGDAAASLARASSRLSQYVGLVEQARSNNRQGYPVGAAYQRQANAVMSTDEEGAIDIVDSLATAEAVQRGLVNDGLARAHRAGALLNLSGWVLLAALVAGGAWLAKTFKRRVNVPLAVAGVALLLTLLVGSGMQGAAMSDADDAVGASLTTADLAAQARSAGYDARSQEALTLINRGNGQANEARWLAAASTARNALDAMCDSGRRGCDLRDLFTEYQIAHVRLRSIDDGGDWDTAVAAVRGSGDGLVTADVSGTFDAFAQQSGALVEDSAAAASAALSSAGSSLNSLRVVVFLAGLVVAGLAIIGYGQRSREYR
jgi:hypothetical protein